MSIYVEGLWVLDLIKKTGDLYIADAYFGVMKVCLEGGLATSLTTEAEGVPFKFTNHLDVDEDGNIYFTDSSINYQRRNFLQLIFSSEDSGRVLKYDPRHQRNHGPCSEHPISEWSLPK